MNAPRPSRLISTPVRPRTSVSTPTRVYSPTAFAKGSSRASPVWLRKRHCVANWCHWIEGWSERGTNRNHTLIHGLADCDERRAALRAGRARLPSFSSVRSTSTATTGGPAGPVTLRPPGARHARCRREGHHVTLTELSSVPQWRPRKCLLCRTFAARAPSDAALWAPPRRLVPGPLEKCLITLSEVKVWRTSLHRLDGSPHHLAYRRTARAYS
jgi:hypothetical protein